MCECKGGYTCPIHTTKPNVDARNHKPRAKRALTIRQALLVVEAGKVGRRFLRSPEMAEAAKVLMGAYRAANNSSRSAGSLAKAYSHFSSNQGCATTPKDKCVVRAGISGYYAYVESMMQYLDTNGVPHKEMSIRGSVGGKWFQSQGEAEHAVALYKKNLRGKTPDLSGYTIDSGTQGWYVYVHGKGYLGANAVTIWPGMLSGGHWFISEPAAIAAVRTHKQSTGLVDDQVTKWKKVADSIKYALTIERPTISISDNRLLPSRLVTSYDIAFGLRGKGHTAVNAEHVVIDKPLSEIGSYIVKLRLHEKVQTEVKVWVVPMAHNIGT